MSKPSSSDPWSRFRFLVVGPLLAAPPAAGELRAALESLSRAVWTHPRTGVPARFALSTIERWYYQARSSEDPIAALDRRPRRDRGRFLAISASLAETLRDQYRDHPGWSVKLHLDNLEVLARADVSLSPLPSYSTLRRYMGRHGLKRVRRLKGRPGEARAQARIEAREVRSYEAEHVHGLWHLDFHHGRARSSLRVAHGFDRFCSPCSMIARG